MAAIYSLFIINKSGGLIFYKVGRWNPKIPQAALLFSDYGSAGRMDTNDSLRLASLWHSMHAISQQLSPTTGCAGIELLQAHTFDLHCFQSLTGTNPNRICRFAFEILILASRSNFGGGCWSKTALGQAEAEKSPGPAETAVVNDRSAHGLEGIGRKRLGREFKAASLQGRLGEGLEKLGVGRVAELVGVVVLVAAEDNGVGGGLSSVMRVIAKRTRGGFSGSRIF
ncbi:hypothetical protein B296_00009588 [Ensete ventricosum]|uniref:Trafficking protein particle complex subunit n=1 Tax=Ensete ventricosum TaxID=4639 RepID=A0A427AX99_ENSVE|nr:hypothetical protein B296_00009588 [Ensete ventricosum]